MQLSTLLLSILPVTTLALPHTNILAAKLLPRSKASSNIATTMALPTSTLPVPAASLELKYVMLGLGSQNYSCTKTPSSTATPASGGALADLYDASSLLSAGSTSAKSNMQVVLPELALSISNAWKITPEKFPSPLNLKHMGKHFFTTDLIPTFVLPQASPPAQIQGKKVGDVPAPVNACPGTMGEGAVDWLQLPDNGLGFSKNTPLAGGDIYRVETAGGAAPKTCANNDGAIIVPYAAMYFFFGPSA